MDEGMMGMPKNELYKKVELTELFYDLVFVYAVSRSTELIRHLSTGGSELYAVLTFAIAFIILINTWMYQTVFTNRYGKNGILDNTILFVQMGLVLILANSMTTDWESSFVPFTVSAGLLSVLLMLQYIVVYFRTSDSNDKRVTGVFITILFFRSAIILISLFFPHNIGIIISLTGILVGFVAPTFSVEKTKQRPVNFPHLTERLSLLVIITFGEMIVGAAEYFNWEMLKIQSVFVLLTVVMMFLLYIVQFEYTIDRYTGNATGVAMIYLHYPIFFGIILTNVAFSYLIDGELQNVFTICFLYAGILLYITGVLLSDLYGKKQMQTYRKAVVWIILLIIGFSISLLFAGKANIVIPIAGMIMTIIVGLEYIRLQKSKSLT